MKILGISAFYHDAAACLLVDGVIVAAVQEERFTRKKHDAAFPHYSIDYCLRYSGIHPDDLDYVVFYEKPFLKFDRLLETYLAFAPSGFKSFATSMPVWLKEKLFQKDNLCKALTQAFKILGGTNDVASRLLFSEHHLSHAASAFFPSPFEEAAILTMDGVGEWTTTSLSIGKGNDLNIHKEICFPHSLGLLYSAFTYFAGFKVNSGEYKLMGLAPYGRPIYVDQIKKHLIDIKEDGSFHLDMSYFNYCTGLTMTNARFAALFGGAPRVPESPITQREMDLAASVQCVTEEIVIALAKGVREETGLRNLCLAGGVALNCVANGKLSRTKLFDQIWIQPAAGDAGGALGAALSVYHLQCKKPRAVNSGSDQMFGAYLGPEYSQEEIEQRLLNAGAIFTTLSDETLFAQTAHALASGAAVGWHQGRMEFGPRSLGGRSILADPRSPSAQRQLNLKVKFRESFRPFAPSVLSEDAKEWFEIEGNSPYMLLVSDVVEAKRLPKADQGQCFGIEQLNQIRSEIPAVTHIDYSARVQTVHQETNPRFHKLISEFKALTGCPVLVNTSFNVRGEPIVCTPEDSFHCFMGTHIEMLVVGNSVLHKHQQNPALAQSYLDKYQLD